MQFLACDELWDKVKVLAKKSRHRFAAVAYVTRDDLVKFRKGDILVVDASDGRIRSNETSASVLKTAFLKKANLFNLPGLHAKVIAFDRVAVIGSANITTSSSSTLIEAALVTDDASTVAQVKSLVDRLTGEAEEIDRDFITRISQIPVKKRRSASAKVHRRKLKVRASGGRTWLIGVRELKEDAFPNEQKRAEAGMLIAKRRLSTKRNDINWIRWTGQGRVGKEAAEGDLFIQVWKPLGGKRCKVYRAAPILYRQEEKNLTRFYIEEEDDSISLGQFRKLAKRLGIPGKIGPSSGRELSPGYASAINLLWDRPIK